MICSVCRQLGNRPVKENIMIERLGRRFSSAEGEKNALLEYNALQGPIRSRRCSKVGFRFNQVDTGHLSVNI